MIKSGNYAIYRGNEFKLLTDINENNIIITKNKNIIDNNFEKTYITGVFSKIVDLSELEEIYTITTYGIYWGDRVLILDEKNGKYLVGTSNCKLAEILQCRSEHFKKIDDYYCEGWLSAERIKIFEEKNKMGEYRIFKNGEYALYKGNEFKLKKDNLKHYTIITDDKSIIDDTFENIYNTFAYRKIVNISELDEVYKITTYGIIGNNEVLILKEKNGKFLVETYDRILADKLGLKQKNMNCYKGWIFIKIIKVFEERKIMGECKAIKNGWFARYRGNKFELSGDMYGNDLIWTNDKSIIDDTFEDKYNSGVFGKIITWFELDEIYRIDTYAIINENNDKCWIEKEKDGKYLLGTNSYDLAKELQFEEVDRSVYERWFSKDDVKIFEKKEILKHNYIGTVNE